MFDPLPIRAITFDLDDTLWPVKPIMVNAERVLREWFATHAPATAQLYAQPGVPAQLRSEVHAMFPDQLHDMALLRRESIRLVLQRSGEDTQKADAAFEVFHAMRQQVAFFDDVLPALARLAARWPLVALSNGTAELARTGLSSYFKTAVSAHTFGVSKPDPRIFAEAARLAGCQAAQVLHVGDDVVADGQGALDAGMQMAWVNRNGHSWHHATPPHLEVSELVSLCERLGV